LNGHSQQESAWARDGGAAAVIARCHTKAQIHAAMTPAQRLRLMGRMTAQAIGGRDVRLRELHPQADEAQLRELRIAATLASSPSTC